MTGVRGPVVISGTDTGVGKTVVTAAIAAAAGRAGLRVAVLKPGQTGIRATTAGEPEESGDPTESDVDTVVRLAGPASARTLATYPDPLAPLAAARESGLPPLRLSSVRQAVEEALTTHDLVLVEGAGGLLVPMGPSPSWLDGGRPGGADGASGAWTIADLAVEMSAPVVVVIRAGLGTLNHTALTLEALDRRALRAYVVVGAWPGQPEQVHRTNLADLGVPLDGMVPAGAGVLAASDFRASAPSWLAASLHGQAAT